ncbi:MAG: hypothetical protein K9K67_14645 [Bacteriovoracaceae bacterium]|nr:hypothetical protein [Bacteriovoracaceae bacterium]
MKLSLFFLSVTLCFQTYGFEIDKRVVARTEEFDAKIVTRRLMDLESVDSYDGKYFKIVYKKNKEAIRFDENDGNIQLKAATTYYHLNKARRYFVEVLNSDFVKSLPKTIIRIDILNKYSELGHFANDNLDPQFNNALSIPTGLGYPERGIKPWNNEIWFRPSKRIHVSELSSSNSEELQMKTIFKRYRNQTHMVSFKNFLSKLLLGDAWSGGDSTVSNVMRLAGTSLFIEGIYRSTGIAMELFKQKYYRLDSALVPEVIYHEYAHVALSDYLAITHSTPVNEGLADYFAGKIANSKELATRIKDYNLFSGKKVRKKQMYRHQFESQDYANADFVFGLLYETEKVIGNKGPVMLYNVRTMIETDSSIRNQLLEGILASCRQYCPIPGLNHIQLLKLFHYRGI